MAALDPAHHLDVEITGYGSGSRTSRSRSVPNRAAERAEAVRTAFTGALERELAARRPEWSPAQVRQRVAAVVTVRDGGAEQGAVPPVLADRDQRDQALIRVATVSAEEAERKLAALDRTDPRMYGKAPSSPADLARRVLQLPPDAVVDDSTKRTLAALLGEAEAAGQARTMGELGAYFLRKPGVLDRLGWIAPKRARHFTNRLGVRVPGLNWGRPEAGTGSLDARETPDRDQVRLDASEIEAWLLSAEGRVVDRRKDSSTLPWNTRTRPYVLVAGGRLGTVTMRLPDRSVRELSIEEAVAVVAADVAREKLDKSVPLVVVTPFATAHDLMLLRMLAGETGHQVWAHSGTTTFSYDSGKLRVAVRTGQFVGDWIGVEPAMAPVPEDTPPAEDWYWEQRNQVITSEKTGRPLAAASLDPESHNPERDEFLTLLDQQKTFWHYNPATGTWLTEEPLPTPPGLSEEDADHQEGHGSPGVLLQSLWRGGSVEVDGQRIESLAARFAELFKGRWHGMMRCWAAVAPDVSAPGGSRGHGDAAPVPFVVDPLRDLSAGQRTANGMRRYVRGAEGIYLAFTRGGGEWSHALSTDARGRRRRWQIFRPEPSGTRLDAWVRELGLHTGTGEATAEVREQVLVQLRALKLTFGRDVEDTDEFLDLMAGVEALQRMWEKEFGAAGGFTLDAFRRTVAAHPEGRQGVDRAGYRAVLKAAREAAPDTALTAFAPLPTVTEAAAWLTREWGSYESATRTVLRPADTGAREVSRLFWAAVKTHDALQGLGQEELEARSSGVLHLDAQGETADDAQVGKMRSLLTRAFARGRDAADPDVAAAYHLDEGGVVEEGTALPSTRYTDGTSGEGRDFRDEAPRVDLTRVESPDGTQEPAPWAGKDPDGNDTPPPYLVRAVVDPADTRHLLLEYSGMTLRVTHGEFVELLAADLVLRAKELRTGLVLDIPELDRLVPGLASRIAQHLGRHVWSTALPTGLSRGGGDGSSLLGTRHPSGASGTASGPAWTENVPVDPAEPVEAPRPVPDPVPEHAPLPGEP
ncbi:hypothetical protein AN220_13015, partial [Streptomyces nanshensis]